MNTEDEWRDCPDWCPCWDDSECDNDELEEEEEEEGDGLL